MSSDQDLDELIETVLARAPEPLSRTAILKALPVGKKPSQKLLKASIDELVLARRIHAWAGKTAKYWRVEAQSFARAQILRALAGGPLLEAEIKQRAGTAVTLKTMKSALAALVTEQKVGKHAKANRYGLGDPNASDYLRIEVTKVLQQLEKRMGFSASELRVALRRYADSVGDDASSTNGGVEEILAAMVRLNPQATHGALIYVAALRAALSRQFSDKDSFDRAVLGLAQAGKVQLQSHAWPSRLSDPEKHTLIPNDQDGFFDAIGLRLE
jgi:hypothetical protein